MYSTNSYEFFSRNKNQSIFQSILDIIFILFLISVYLVPLTQLLDALP